MGIWMQLLIMLRSKTQGLRELWFNGFLPTLKSLNSTLNSAQFQRNLKAHATVT